MAKTSLATIKGWFTTGKFPTQDQFWNWMDSFWHKDEKLATSDIDGLDDLIQGKATTEDIQNLQDQIDNIVNPGPISEVLNENAAYEIPAGKWLKGIAVMPAGDLAAFGVGNANGVNDIFPDTPVANGDAEPFTLDIYTKEAKTIWFNGITAQTTVKIYLQ